ncbi:MAG: pyruvoyl-dependent arginine decarboxylase [Candidatus Micrarchaeota archaeon]|nr:pyruvoyl-dependent arginine decarboxylase [Candidatus Micrarchaeota archaeon]
MKIHITWGSGEGETGMGAFDAALFDAGIGNYNLIPLSSVIPEGAEITVGRIDRNNEEHGHRLYCVIAKCIETKKGARASAGIGWVVDNESGKGVFAEHCASNESKLSELIKKTLETFARTRNWKNTDISYKMHSAACRGKPVCAVVCAVFESEGWIKE